MLNSIIRFALSQRLFVVAIALALMGYGSWQIGQLEIDVLPNLNRPRVTLLTEAHGMAPEEVETLITLPIESVLNGANGVQAVRSSSGIGLSVIYVEFDWGTDIFKDRQIVNERLALIADQLPAGIKPQLAPISSIMGQILMIGMWSKDGQTTPLEVRTLADWVVRQRLLTVPGVSQVFTMGGDRQQFQILVNPDEMLRYGVTMHDIKQAAVESNQNATGGFLDEQGPNEYLVRALGRVETSEDLEKLVVKVHQGRPIPLSRVAKVIAGPQVKRGNSSAIVRTDQNQFTGGNAVVLTINKQPEADTRRVTTEILAALEDLKHSLPNDIYIQPELYTQKSFIDRAIHNVLEALRDGSILVIVILFLFLLNFRTTLITLTSIPLSILMTVVIFSVFGLSVNTMTLGGLAVAIGELMDDAIVDVENIFRRLRENRLSNNPQPALIVVYQASSEIRNSIVFGTMIVVLGFMPLFALSGLAGRIFTPLGIAYIVAIICSLIVSLTITPVLSYWLLPQAGVIARQRDSFVLRILKFFAEKVIRFSLHFSWLVLIVALSCTLWAGFYVLHLERDFLPPFNEGVVQLNVMLPPGSSLKQSDLMTQIVEKRLKEIDDVQAFVKRTGRAELDEHIAGVNLTEMIISFDPQSPRSRGEILEDIRSAMEDIPGINATAEQPLAHLISHMLSGVTAQVAIKLFGDDLETLRKTAEKMKTALSDIPEIKDLQVEPQVMIPQFRIELDRDRLLLYGLTPVQVSEFVETAMNGNVVSTVLVGQRTFDLLVRLDEPFRENLAAIRRLAIELDDGGIVPLSAVAKIYESSGPNMINREKVRRRIVLQCNVAGKGLVDVVQEIQQRLEPLQKDLPAGYFLEYGGLFESQQIASQRIKFLFVVMLAGIFLVLYSMFGSANYSFQVLTALPMAFIGSVIALMLTNQTLTIAAMVGFVSLGGIASRNGILLLNHYLHLIRYEGETISQSMIIRAGQERLAPVLMTALTSGIGLIPLILTAEEPGKEILYPIATVHIGGIISSTLLEFFVRPALFWIFGRRATQKILADSEIDFSSIKNSETQSMSS